MRHIVVDLSFSITQGNLEERKQPITSLPICQLMQIIVAKTCLSNYCGLINYGLSWMFESQVEVTQTTSWGTIIDVIREFVGWSD